MDIDNLYNWYKPEKDERRNLVISANSLVAPLFNFDYDGDLIKATAFNSAESMVEKPNYNIHNKLMLESKPKDSQLLVGFEHENIFAAFMLSKKANEFMDETMDVRPLPSNPSLNTLKESVSERTALFRYKINGQEYVDNYFIAVLNQTIKKRLFVSTDILNKKTFNKKIDNLYSDPDRNIKYTRLQRVLHYVSSTMTDGIAGFDLDEFSISSPDITSYREQLVQSEPVTAYHQNIILFEDHVLPVLNETENIFTKLLESGTALKPIQLQKAVANNGVQTNLFNQAQLSNIRSPLINGMTKEEYHSSGDAARLALVLRESAIPTAGSLMRQMLYQTGFIKRAHGKTCSLKRTFRIEIMNTKHIDLLEGRNARDEKGEMYEINDENCKVGDMINLFSPVECTLPNGHICDVCYGTYNDVETINLGVIVAADISEAIIQSALSSHHTGGIYMSKRDNEFLDICKQMVVINRNGKELLKLPESSYNTYKTKLYDFYKDEATHLELDLNEIIEFHEDETTDDYVTFHVEVKHSPRAEDAEKTLHKIIALLTSSGKKADHVKTPELLYRELIKNINLPSNLLSVLSEILVSILFVDNNGNFLRYSDSREVKKVNLNLVMDIIDTTTSILNGYSKVKNTKIFLKSKTVHNQFEHMDRVLTSYYH